MSTFIRARQCLSHDRGLAALLPEARRLRAWEAGLAEVLGPLASQLQIAGVKGSTLWLACQNGAIAARLRSLEQTILTAMARQGVDVEQIKVRVRADSVWERPRQKPQVSARGLAALDAFLQVDANAHPADTQSDELRAAVARLRDHQRR